MNRRRSSMWLFLGLGLLMCGFVVWLFRASEKSPAPRAGANAKTAADFRLTEGATAAAIRPASTAPVIAPLQNTNNGAAEVAQTEREQKLKYRLSNTTQTVNQLARNPRGILLENALIDTSLPQNFSIPSVLKSHEDPGSYLVQSTGEVNNDFRAMLEHAGARIVSYFPNNTFLVRMTAGQSQDVASKMGVQAVLPFEPYYKLDLSLLRNMLEQKPVATSLNLLVFSDAKDSTVSALNQMGANIVGESPSPFGTVLVVHNATDVPAIAKLPGIQRVETHTDRRQANDLTRARIKVSANPTTQTNYLGLDGKGVLVAMSDFGFLGGNGYVDATHPALAGRVFGPVPQASLVDSNGHATHVAGIIIGDGKMWETVSNAVGSPRVSPTMPFYNTNQFRGMAPAANLYSLSITPNLGFEDYNLQRLTARTNALISNNSWTYENQDYDIFASSYDAAVRDALPEQTGSQPVLFVFAAGNDGAGTDDGANGVPGSILSPATAKNVITVGAAEQQRNITNAVTRISGGETNITFPWAGLTDSSNQVAAFSSRGNVGYGIEGDFGRFKPDVVAPGTFVVSTRSQQWNEEAYYNPVTAITYDRGPVVVTNGGFVVVSPGIFVDDNAVQLIVQVTSSDPNVDIPIYVRQNAIPSTTTFDATGVNQVSLPPDGPLNVGTIYRIGVANPNTNVPVTVRLTAYVLVTNALGNYFEVLSNLNNDLGPYYRYESGTSMSAAAVSGQLALMQQFFQEHGVTNSPALMKALVINGARALSSSYFFTVANTLNSQGWGLVNLTNCLPAAFMGKPANNIVNPPLNTPLPLLMFDQNPADALATGESHTFNLKVDPVIRNQPLRFTLVWTDPAGNPNAGLKLVNNLDLIVTNLDNPTNILVYYGNDFGPGTQFTFKWDTNNSTPWDIVNNVENVYLLQPVGSNYSVTVRARAVNVNAVTAHTNDIVQDYALVISSGNGFFTNALTLTADNGIVRPGWTNLTALTNQFDTAEVFGQSLAKERVGANSPLIGTNLVPYKLAPGEITMGKSSQWHFYVITNSSSQSAGFTNAFIATSLPFDLAAHRMGVTNVTQPDEIARAQADIDIYWTDDPGLLTLESNAVANALKSQKRGGYEMIVQSNAVPGNIYYLGVKSEDQQAAQYNLLVLFTLTPLNQGNNTVLGVPVPQYLPDGTPEKPSLTEFHAPFAGEENARVRRVIVTNLVSHDNFPDLVGAITHDGEKFAILNNHRPNNNNNFPDFNVYDDTSPNAAFHSDGIENLLTFIGDPLSGDWILDMTDNAQNHTGTNWYYAVHIDPHIEVDENGTVQNCVTVQPNAFEYDFVEVPFDALSVEICIISNSGPQIQLYVRNGALPTTTAFDYTVPLSSGECTTISTGDIPPLQAGTLYFGIYNPNASAQDVCYRATIRRGANVQQVNFNSTNNPVIKDDAITYSTIAITNNQRIASAAVGIALDHPRVSDLVLTLIGPTGKRYTLFDERGGSAVTNIGHINITTNFFGTTAAGDANASTNIISPVPTSGTLLIDYEMFQLCDTIQVEYDGRVLTNTGCISGNGTLQVDYGPGVGNSITVIMNPDGNTEEGTRWYYTPRVVSLDYTYLTFTENPNLTKLPVKFANQPFDLGGTGTNWVLSNFEMSTNGEYFATTNIFDLFSGWSVLTNDVLIGTNVFSMTNFNEVSVVTDPSTAQQSVFTNTTVNSNFLALAKGAIVRTIDTIPGRKYTVSYLYRGPGIAGWWRGEGNATDGADPESLGNNGETIGRFEYPAGAVGQAFQFEDAGQQFRFAGTNTYIQVRQSESLDAGRKGGLTVEGWINPTNVSFQQPLVEWLAPVPTNWVPRPFNENTNFTYPYDTNMSIVAGPFLNRANLHYYYLLASTNWTTSETWARQLGGHLVTVDDANEQFWIYDSFAQYGGTNRWLWIGLTNDVPNHYAWASGQPNLFYTNWVSGQPTNCAGIYTTIISPTNAQGGLWALADNSGISGITNCISLRTNQIHGVVEVNSIQTNGVQLWVSVTNSAIIGNGRLYADIVDVSNISHVLFSPAGLIQSNVFQHVALTYNTNSGLATLFYNGTNVASTNFGSFIPKTGGGVLLGKDMSLQTNNYYAGKQDEISIYARSISPSEIAAIYQITAYATNYPFATNDIATNRIFGKFDARITPALSLAEAQVSLGGVTNIILGANDRWQTHSFTFTAASTNVTMQFVGIEPGMLLDSFDVALAPPGNMYVLPEELMTDLLGESSKGSWTLEIRDARAGGGNTNDLAQLISWQLQFIFQNQPLATPLDPFQPATNVVPAHAIAYYSVDVPSWAGYATNILVSASQPVSVLFNQTAPPSGTTPGNFNLIGPALAGSATLVTNGVPQLLPGQRYYLGVTNAGNAPATVQLRVDYNIITLSNSVPVLAFLNTNDTVQYFAFDVSSTNAIEATFQLLKVSNNVDLVVSKGLPLPTLTTNDFGSFTAGNADEDIYVLTNSFPTPVSMGRWYLGVFKRTANVPAQYAVLAKELIPTTAPLIPNVITLFNNIPTNFTAGPGAALTNFFRFNVNTTPPSLRFVVYNMTGDVDLTVQTNGFPLAPTFFGSSRQKGQAVELVFIHTNSALTNLNGQWYLGVPNRETNLVSYTIVASIDTNSYFPAFPGAEGAGGGATGGRFGDVYHVTSLNDSGPGTLREGVTTATTNRTIVFDLSGTIRLLSRLVISNSNLTIAGQTAPGGGITISGQMTSLQNVHDVVVRYVRFRLGETDSELLWANDFEGGSGFNEIFAPNSFAGWHVDSGSVDWLPNGTGGGAQADQGSYFVDLNGNSPGAISTNVVTVPGKAYSLNFAYSQNPDGPLAGHPTATTRIFQNGNVLLDVSITSPNTSWGSLTWVQTSVVFTATSPLTQIQFASQTAADYGMLLDSVSLNLVGAGGDSLQIFGSTNVIADHVTAASSMDAGLSAYWSTNITVQWSVIAQNWNTTNLCSANPPPDGFGSVLRYGDGALSFHHNLYAEDYRGTPRLGDKIKLDFVNNLVYNWGALPGFSTNDIADNPSGFTNYLNYICNYVIAGPNTATNMLATAFLGGTTKTYIWQTNNLIDSNTNGILDGANTGWLMFTNQFVPAFYSPTNQVFPELVLSVDEAFLAYEKVLDFAGASLDKRDLQDRTVVAGVRSQSARSLPVLSGIVAWWKGESNTVDGVNGNNGVATGVSYGAGEVGKAFQFDGSTSFITAPASQSLAVSNLTFEGWIYPTSTQYEPIVEYGGPGQFSPVHFWLNGAGLNGNLPGVLYANIRNTPLGLSSAGVVPQNSWSHVAFTLDVTTGAAALYYNGVQVAAANLPLPVDLDSTLVPVNIGYRQASSPDLYSDRHFAGRLDEISIYNRALSACEIAAIYNAGSAGKGVSVSATAPGSTNSSTQPYLDWDQDGVPDFWEMTLGEESTNATASFVSRVGGTPGYTDLEEYLNWLGVPHALTTTNKAVDVDLYRLAGNTGNLTFFVTNAVNGTVYLTNRYFLTNGTVVLSNTVAYFTPTNISAGTNFSGFASFDFYTTNTDTVAYFGPTKVSVFVSRVPITNVTAATVINLTNTTYCTTNTAGTNGVDYYSYFVSTNLSSFKIVVTPDNGYDVDLYVRYGRPLPGPGLFDYASTNSGNVAESVTVTNNSVPMPTLSGFWYFAVSNAAGMTNVSYCINIEEFTNIPPIVVDLENGIPTCPTNNNVGTNALDYYKYVVSSNAIAVQFEVLNPSADVTLLARRGGLPSLTNFDYDSTNPGTANELIMVWTNSTPVPLTPGNWFLAVVNLTGSNISYCVQATEITNNFPNIVTLSNAVPYVTNTPVAETGYYRFVVPTNAARAQFEVNNPNADVTLVLRKGLPLPSLTNYAYISTNSYTNDEVIILFTNSAPVPLTPGDWYLSVVNISGGDVDYSVKATWWPITGLPVQITGVTISGGNFCITWSSLPGVRYFVQGINSLGGTNWTTVASDILANDYSTTWCTNFPPPFNFFRVGEGFSLSTNVAPPIVTLTNLIPYSATNSLGTNGLNFYRYRVSANATGTVFQVTGLDGDVALVARKGLPLPSLTPGTYHYITNNPGTSDEVITVFTTSSPVPLSPGDWYLAVASLTNSPVGYTITAIELTNTFGPIITLTNGIPYAKNGSAAGATDYYLYTVTNVPAVRAQFEVLNPTADVTLVLRKGPIPPLPSLAVNDDFSANSGSNPELIVLFSNSPVALTSGDWYLGVVNVSGGPVNYSVKASEWASTGRPINVTNVTFSGGAFCITWESLPGVNYHIEGINSLGGTNWTIASPTIVATNYSTTYCISPVTNSFYRVAEGLVLSAFASPSPVLTVIYTNSNFLLTWNGPTTATNQLQWASNLPPSWNSFTNIFIGGTGQYSFLDDGTQTGGFGVTRFYRVIVLP